MWSAVLCPTTNRAAAQRRFNVRSERRRFRHFQRRFPSAVEPIRKAHSSKTLAAARGLSRDIGENEVRLALVHDQMAASTAPGGAVLQW